MPARAEYLGDGTLPFRSGAGVIASSSRNAPRRDPASGDAAAGVGAVVVASVWLGFCLIAVVHPWLSGH